MKTTTRQPKVGKAQVGKAQVGKAQAGKAQAGEDMTSEAKPRARGWIHAIMFPLVTVAGIVLVVAAPTQAGRISTAIFTVTAMMLFGNSALYHRGHWSPQVAGVLRRIDHSNIALIIAGTYTPLAVVLLPQSTATVLLWVVWVGALAVILLRVLWIDAPRWSYVPLYLALGWVAVWFLPTFWRSGGAAITSLVIAGGVAYSAGAVIYGLKRPNPWPRTFGFHEIFHACTAIGYTCHFIAVALTVMSAH